MSSYFPSDNDRSRLRWRALDDEGDTQPLPLRGPEAYEWHVMAREIHNDVVFTPMPDPGCLRNVIQELTNTSEVGSKARIYSIEGIEDLNNITIAKVAQSIRNVIFSRYPSHLGKDNTITRYIHTAHPGGRGIELTYTPNWSLAYKASLKASLPDGTETAPLHDYTSLECSQFVGPERDHMAIGHWPVHTADDDQSGLLKALHQVSCVAKNHADLDNFLDDIDVELPRNGDAISFSKIIPCTRSVVTLNPFSVERSDTEVKLTLEASLAVWIRGEQDDRDLLPATQHKD